MVAPNLNLCATSVRKTILLFCNILLNQVLTNVDSGLVYTKEDYSDTFQIVLGPGQMCKPIILQVNCQNDLCCRYI